MAGTFKPAALSAKERTPTRYRVEQDAYLCDLWLASVLAGAPLVVADAPGQEYPVIAWALKQWRPPAW